MNIIKDINQLILKSKDLILEDFSFQSRNINNRKNQKEDYENKKITPNFKNLFENLRVKDYIEFKKYITDLFVKEEISVNEISYDDDEAGGIFVYISNDKYQLLFHKDKKLYAGDAYMCKDWKTEIMSKSFGTIEEFLKECVKYMRVELYGPVSIQEAEGFRFQHRNNNRKEDKNQLDLLKVQKLLPEISELSDEIEFVKRRYTTFSVQLITEVSLIGCDNKCLEKIFPGCRKKHEINPDFYFSISAITNLSFFINIDKNNSLESKIIKEYFKTKNKLNIRCCEYDVCNIDDKVVGKIARITYIVEEDPSKIYREILYKKL